MRATVLMAAFLIATGPAIPAVAQSQADKTGTAAAAGQEEIVAVGALTAAAVVAAIGTAVAVTAGDRGDTVSSTQTS